MLIHYAKHARRQMQRRKITEAEVEAVLQGSTTMKIATSKKTQYKALVGGRMVKVGVAPDVDTDVEKLVTTAMVEGEDG